MNGYEQTQGAQTWSGLLQSVSRIGGLAHRPRWNSNNSLSISFLSSLIPEDFDPSSRLKCVLFNFIYNNVVITTVYNLITGAVASYCNIDDCHTLNFLTDSALSFKTYRRPRIERALWLGRGSYVKVWRKVFLEIFPAFLVILLPSNTDCP